MSRQRREPGRRVVEQPGEFLVEGREAEDWPPRQMPRWKSKTAKFPGLPQGGLGDGMAFRATSFSLFYATLQKVAVGRA
jgi:hypothetical protein